MNPQTGRLLLSEVAEALIENDVAREARVEIYVRLIDAWLGEGADGLERLDGQCDAALDEALREAGVVDELYSDDDEWL